MRWTPAGLIVLALLAAPSSAAEFSAGLESPSVIAADATKPAPELVRLDRELTRILEAKEQGRITPDRFKDFAIRFRADLDAAKAAASPSPANTALHARILRRLGEFTQAGEVLSAALEHDPKNPALRVALSQVRFGEKNFPAALAEANAALALDPANEEALVLKHFSEGRVAMNVETAGNHAPALARKSFARRFHFVAADPATLPFKLPVKIAPATAPPDLIARGEAPAAPGPLPLLPLAVVAGLGLAAYEISRSRSAYESTDGLDDAHPKPVGQYQRLVAGAILAGALGGLVFTAGAAALSAAPVALSYATNVGSQGLRLASSEAGAINPIPSEKAEEAVPQGEAAVVEAEQIVIKKGEILNRVWHSDWIKGSDLSGPNGYSYCRGACLPIHAARAVEGRGLSVGVINNARVGALYHVTEDIFVFVRRSIGGFDEEILLRSPADMRKLELLQEHVSKIPSGT